jgi:hypothetical protein
MIGATARDGVCGRIVEEGVPPRSIGEDICIYSYGEILQKYGKGQPPDPQVNPRSLRTLISDHPPLGDPLRAHVTEQHNSCCFVTFQCLEYPFGTVRQRSDSGPPFHLMSRYYRGPSCNRLVCRLADSCPSPVSVLRLSCAVRLDLPLSLARSMFAPQHQSAPSNADNLLCEPWI